MKKLKMTLAASLVLTAMQATASNPASTEYVNIKITEITNYFNSSLTQINNTFNSYKNDVQTSINQLIQNLPKTPTYCLCQAAQGGIIAEINSTGTHGVVVATRDLEDSSGNTTFMYAPTVFPYEIDPNDPEYYLDNSDGHNNYFDWRYPTAYELRTIMNAMSSCSNITFSTTDYYWTTTVNYGEFPQLAIVSTTNWNSEEPDSGSHRIRTIRVF